MDLLTPAPSLTARFRWRSILLDMTQAVLTEVEGFPMLSYEAALRHILDTAKLLGTERVALSAAAGRVLAEDVLAPQSLPEFDYSAMDGYALASKSFPGIGPWTLKVRGESRAGAPAVTLADGSACRIFTGAPLPSGADCVVMQEDVQRDQDAISLLQRPKLGAHVRRAGEDLSAGQLALARGTRLTPYQLGLLATLGRAHLVVARRPRVRILCTGDELTLPGDAAKFGTVRESNGVALAALAERAGAYAELAPLCRDSAGELQTAMARSLESADVLVTVGGVSVGDYDLVQEALKQAGGSVDFWKVAIKPGKPLLFGRAGACRVLGLPGNPASAQVTFTLFGLPLLRQLQGDAQPELPWRTLTLASAIEQRPGRRGFYHVQAKHGVATPLSNQASGAPTGIAWADGLVSVPAEAERAEAGSSLDALLFREL